MFCTECGTKNRDAAKFCMSCGHSMDAPGPAGDAAAPVRPSVSLAAPSPIPAANSSSERADFYRQRSERIQKLTGVKGWLWFLCLSLGVLGPALSFGSLQGVWMTTIQGDADFIPGWRSYLAAYSVMVAAMVVAAMVITFRLYNETYGAPKLAKYYYFLTPLVIVIGSGFLWELFGYGTMPDRIQALVFSVDGLRLFAASFIWLPYLYLSKRVQYTYPDHQEHVRCPECRRFVHKYSIQCRHCGVKLVPTDAQ